MQLQCMYPTIEAYAKVGMIIPRSRYTGRVGPHLLISATAPIFCLRETGFLCYLFWQLLHQQSHSLSCLILCQNPGKTWLLATTNGGQLSQEFQFSSRPTMREKHQKPMAQHQRPRLHQRLLLRINKHHQVKPVFLHPKPVP